MEVITMAMYSFTCDKEHEPITFSVEAENDDKALSILMKKTWHHSKHAHPGMAEIPKEERMEMIKNNWKKT